MIIWRCSTIFCHKGVTFLLIEGGKTVRDAVLYKICRGVHLIMVDRHVPSGTYFYHVHQTL